VPVLEGACLGWIPRSSSCHPSTFRAPGQRSRENRQHFPGAAARTLWPFQSVWNRAFEEKNPNQTRLFADRPWVVVEAIGLQLRAGRIGLCLRDKRAASESRRPALAQPLGYRPVGRSP